jgi:GNAT superfamily N-acetyltransferase
MNWQVNYANLRLPPDLAGEYMWLQKIYKRGQEEYRLKTPPIRRLQNRIKEHCSRAKACSWRFFDNVWVWNDSVVFELENASWDDVPGSGQWLAYLRRMYVVDSKRGCGYGSHFISALLKWAEDSGAAICLVSIPFGMSRSSHDKGPFFLESVGDVLGIWETGELHHVVGGEWLRHWYSSKGFRRANVLDDHFFKFKSIIDEKDQFVFIPNSLDVAAKVAVSHRLKNEPLDESATGRETVLIGSEAGKPDGGEF